METRGGGIDHRGCLPGIEQPAAVCRRERELLQVDRRLPLDVLLSILWGSEERAAHMLAVGQLDDKGDLSNAVIVGGDVS